jgi:hypothetical protein
MTNRAKKRAVVGALGFLVAAFITLLLWEYIVNLRAQHAAERLLHQVRTLKVDESTEEDATRIVNEFGAIEARFPGYCDKVDSVRSTEVSSRILNRVGRKNPGLRWFGNSAWEVQAHFAIAKGQVCFVEYSISANPSTYSKGARFVLNSTATYYHPFAAFPDFSYGVGLRNVHNFHDLSAAVTSLGTADEQQRAFDFDLSCLSRFGGCKSVCELMPSAWLDYQKEAKEKGLDIPADELADPRCNRR